MTKLTIYRWQGGDWEAIQVRDKLVYEGHGADSWEWADILRIFGVEVIEKRVIWPDDSDGPMRFREVTQDDIGR
uniref:Uncharacterized protein n=1 Tax=viral metagenome TaxID=1070528 RepID=A0A6M3JPC3_9ZZZZ